MLWSILTHHVHKDFSRKQFLDMDDGEMLNVRGRPDMHRGDVKRGYWPVPVCDPDNPVIAQVGQRGVFFNPIRVKAMKTIGVDEGEMEERYKKWCEENGWEYK